MRSQLFRNTRDEIPYCEKCGSHSPIRYIREVDSKKMKLCPLCSSDIPLGPIKHKQGKPSIRIEMEEPK